MEWNKELGFGIMRCPYKGKEIDYEKTKEIIDEYMKGDFCYFDVHPAYMGGKSQDILREYVVKKYPRECFFVANKMPYYNINRYRDYEIIFYKELSACGVEYFDYYMLHALTRDVYNMHQLIGGFDFLRKKKSEGKIKHIGFSFHDKPELLEEILMEHPEVDFVQLQVNFMDWKSNTICSRRCYEIARKHGKAIIIMEPMKGGALVNKIKIAGKSFSGSELAKLSLEFIAALPGVQIILSGMSAVDHVIENRKTLECISASAERNEKLYESLRTKISSKNQIQCTACGYCLRECYKNIPIPDIISAYNAYCIGKQDEKRLLGGSGSVYRGIVFGKGKASDCINCGNCEHVCPQKLKISKHMKEATRMFERKVAYMNYYTIERNAQILIYLMKAHGIKKVIASPGGTNPCFVYSVQQDDYFELYSAIDERSAAYMACGLAEECGEPVAISCTGATAARNYMPALTEAYYRNIPVLAVTSSQPEVRIGHNIPQVTDRRNPPGDIARMSVTIPNIHNLEEEWFCETTINTALLELSHRSGGPVHINLETYYSRNFSVKKLPPARVIRRINVNDTFPEITKGKIGIFVGIHSPWNEKLDDYVRKFCQQYNAVVISDHTGNYAGNNGISASLPMAQAIKENEINRFDLMIHMGHVSAAYFHLIPDEVWRLDADGLVKDPYHRLTHVFEMDEEDFFYRYVSGNEEAANFNDTEVVDILIKEYTRLYEKIPALPFSNPWIAQQTSYRLPENSVVHMGILNSFRSWNLFKLPKGVKAFCNTGGFGTDGCVSSLIGASLANLDKIYYGIVGDLAFFYDMNILGNRHIGPNVRILMINNGCGVEFKVYRNWYKSLGDEVDEMIAAAGHNGNKSETFVKNLAQNLGFEYFPAKSKKEYMEVIPYFTSKKIGEKPMIVEAFVDCEAENDAITTLYTLDGEKPFQETGRNKSKPRNTLSCGKKRNVVLWGIGYNFDKFLHKVENICTVKYACDNNRSKWGKEIVPGIKCISPKELIKMKDVFVVIMVGDVKAAFSIMNQLFDMGITEVDHINNWLDYANSEYFR